MYYRLTHATIKSGTYDEAMATMKSIRDKFSEINGLLSSRLVRISENEIMGIAVYESQELLEASQTKFNDTKASVKDNKLHTVCEEAKCPNIHECWSSGDATFMIAGQECTRGCRFCAVGTIKRPPPLDVDEPKHLADAVESMNLRHLVITVVNRDDLPDSGAAHYKACIDEVHKRLPNLTIELLCSDLAGDLSALELLLEDSPLNVFAHNVECVPELDATVRDHRASFNQSIEILKHAKKLRPDIITKTSLLFESYVFRYSKPAL